MSGQTQVVGHELSHYLTPFGFQVECSCGTFAAFSHAKHKTHEAGEHHLAFVSERGSATVAFLLLALVPVGLLVWFVAMIAGAVSGSVGA